MLATMLDRDDIEFHWKHERTAYTCADLVEVAVKRTNFLLDRKYLLGDTNYPNYLYGNREIFANG